MKLASLLQEDPMAETRRQFSGFGDSTWRNGIAAHRRLGQSAVSDQRRLAGTAAFLFGEQEAGNGASRGDRKDWGAWFEVTPKVGHP
jgi:hypothetical protein